MPSKSASQLEAEIDAATDRVRSLIALGIWLRMRRWIETSSHEGHLMIDGLAGNLERTSLRFGRSPSWLSLRLRRLNGLIEINADGAIYSPILKKLMLARAKNAAKQRKHRKGGYVPTQGGLCTHPEGVTVGVTPPLEVSSPTTPSSLSPPITYSGGNTSAFSQQKRASFQAFDLWARSSINRPLAPEHNEFKPISDLVESTAQDPPVLRGSESIPRNNLVAQAAEHCRLNRKDFKGVKYACQTVKNLLEEWARKGMPGINGAEKGGSKPGTRLLAVPKAREDR